MTKNYGFESRFRALEGITTVSRRRTYPESFIQPYGAKSSLGQNSSIMAWHT